MQLTPLQTIYTVYGIHVICGSHRYKILPYGSPKVKEMDERGGWWV